jgi:hypothetical protein
MLLSICLLNSHQSGNKLLLFIITINFQNLLYSILNILYYVSDGKWYCSKKCKSTRKTPKRKTPKSSTPKVDHVREYSRALLWRAVSYLSRVESERQNDGPALVRYWKLDMADFWAKGHNKYMILAHRLTAGM